MEPDNPRPLKKGPRFWLGLFFFVLFATTPAFIPLVVLLPIPDGAKAAVSAAMVLGIPEFFAVISAWLLGRETFDALMRPIHRVIRRISPPEVSRRRYAIGLVLFLTPLAEAFVFLHTNDWRELFEGHYVLRAIAWNAMFWGSFLVLGGDFRGKVKALFVREAKAVFPVRPMLDDENVMGEGLCYPPPASGGGQGGGSDALPDGLAQFRGEGLSPPTCPPPEAGGG